MSVTGRGPDRLAPLREVCRRPLTREALLWLLVLVGVLNFAPSLFTPLHLVGDPVWRKALKDLPVLALLALALLAGRSAVPVDPRVAARLRRLAVTAAVLAAMMAIDALVRQPDGFGLLVSLRYYVLYPLLALAVWRLGFTREQVARFAAFVCAVGALEAIAALLSAGEVFGPTYYSYYIRVGGEFWARGIGTLGNPDNLGLFLGLPALVLTFAPPASFGRTARAGLLGLVGLGLMVTFSKSAAVALPVTIALILLTRGVSRATLRKLLLLVTGMVAALAAIAVARYWHGFGAQDLLGSRVEANPASWERWTADGWTFLFGEGYGSGSTAEGGAISQVVTDNMLLAMGLEAGVVGLVLLCALGVGALRVLLLAVRATPSPLSMALLAYGVYFLLYTPIAVNFRLFPGAMLFWVAVGLAATLVGPPSPPASGAGQASQPAYN